MPGVVGAAEESAVKAAGDAALRLRAAPHQNDPEKDARWDSEAAFLNVALRQPCDHKRHGDAGQNNQKQESALHQKIARTALEQDRNFKRPVLHHCVGKRQWEDAETDNGRHHEPEGVLVERLVLGQGNCGGQQHGADTDNSSPYHDQCLAAVVEGGSLDCVPDQRGYTEQETTKFVNRCEGENGATSE